MQETEIARKAANALIPSAVAHASVPGRAQAVIEDFQAAYGGLWVGGRVILTDQALRFEPNAVNRLAHAAGSVGTVNIPLAAVGDIYVQWGVLTKIIIVMLGEGEFRVRCFGADSFAEKIRQAAARHR